MSNSENTNKHTPDNQPRNHQVNKPPDNRRRASSSEFTQPTQAASKPSKPSGWQQPVTPIPTPTPPAYPPPPAHKSSPPPRRKTPAPRPTWLLPVGVIVLFGGTLVCGLLAFVILRFASNARNTTPGATQVSAAV